MTPWAKKRHRRRPSWAARWPERMRPGRIFEATSLRRSESGRLDTPLNARKIREAEYSTEPQDRERESGDDRNPMSAANTPPAASRGDKHRQSGSDPQRIGSATITRSADHIRRRDCRRRARRADARPPAAAEAPHVRVLVARETPAPGAGSGLQGRRVERRDRRALLSAACSASSRICASSISKSSACATSSRTRRTSDITRRVELGPPFFPAGAVVPARSRPPRELAARRPARLRRRRCSTTARVKRIELEARRAHAWRSPGPAARHGPDALGGRRQRPRRAAPASARARPCRSARRQRRVVPRQHARQARRLVRRSGVAGARAVRPALA